MISSWHHSGGRTQEKGFSPFFIAHATSGQGILRNSSVKHQEGLKNTSLGVRWTPWSTLSFPHFHHTPSSSAQSGAAEQKWIPEWDEQQDPEGNPPLMGTLLWWKHPWQLKCRNGLLWRTLVTLKCPARKRGEENKNLPFLSPTMCFISFSLRFYQFQSQQKQLGQDSVNGPWFPISFFVILCPSLLGAGHRQLLLQSGGNKTGY